MTVLIFCTLIEYLLRGKIETLPNAQLTIYQELLKDFALDTHYCQHPVALEFRNPSS